MADISPEYVKEVPPIDTGLDYLPLELKINVESVLDVNAVGSSIQILLQINLTWSEPRLEFNHIVDSDGEDHHFLPSELMNALWMPTIFFVNTKNKLTASFGGGNATGIISLKSGAIGYKSEMHELRNEVRYRGKDW